MPTDGRMYRIPRRSQLSQAHKANIDYKIGNYLVPEKVKFEWQDSDYRRHHALPPASASSTPPKARR